MILLIEDDRDDELLMQMALKDSNIQHELVVVRDGVAALDFLYGTGEYAGRDLSVMPSLILLDLKLPKMDGLEVLRHINDHKRIRVIPIVVLTSSSRDEDMMECYRLGANSYIQKPMNLHDFVDVVRQLGDYWLKLNKVP
ncbi:MAG: response regulator [Deltaproteobacteria bacterium]|jgi:CheY-like chemotaxis protein|nr:response regulator [Deltaproteobacteria bacterium]